MDPDTREQINELAALRDAHERRLRVLVLQAAKTGIQTDASRLIEIQEIEQEITKITTTLAELQAGEARAIERKIRAANTNDLHDISVQLFDFSQGIDRNLRRLFELLLVFQDRDSARRQRREHIVNLFYITIAVLVFVDILLRVLR